MACGNMGRVKGLEDKERKCGKKNGMCMGVRVCVIGIHIKINDICGIAIG